jgi:transposase
MGYLSAQGKPKTGKVSKADMALSMIAKLYRIETQIQSLSLEERLYFRRTHSAAELMQFKQWLDKSAQQVSKQSSVVISKTADSISTTTELNAQ